MRFILMNTRTLSHFIFLSSSLLLIHLVKNYIHLLSTRSITSLTQVINVRKHSLTSDGRAGEAPDPPDGYL